MFENEWFSKANAIGVSWSEFWNMNPRIIKLLLKGHEEKIKEQDYLAWLFSQYTLSAVSVAVEHCLAGRKARSEYIKEPIMSKVFEDDGLTEEQITEKEIKKAILTEQRFMAMAINRGLPETIVK